MATKKKRTTAKPPPKKAASKLALTLLHEPPAAIRHAMLLRVRAMRPGKAIVPVGSGAVFGLLPHAHAGHAAIEVTDAFDTEWAYSLGEEVATHRRYLRVGSVRVRWKSHLLEVFHLCFPSAFGAEQHHELIVADTLDVAERYFVEVCEFAAEVHGEVLVFANGCWDKSVRLHQSIQATRWDDLVLAGDLAQRLRDDFDRFLTARAEYARWRVPWKRGALFVGPPGNGKTMAVRTLAKHLGLPCLYVQSFVAARSTEQASMEAVFARARRAAPCLMVLEDLDSLVTPGARSFFLNELDGFAANEGLITIASTNHPDRLDPALVDRPSRFDRKYHFDPPAEAERRAYAATWNGRLPEGLALDDTALDGIGATTGDFSFAYLKELFAAALMRLMSGPVERSRFLDALRVETAALRAQMKTTNVVPDTPGVLVDAEAEF